MRRSVRVVRVLLLSACLILAGGLTAQPLAFAAADVLILSTTVAGGVASREALAAQALGLTVEIATPAQWAAKTSAEFGAYRSIVLGDPDCAQSPSPLAAAEANRNVWGPQVVGNVLVMGTDPVAHAAVRPGAQALIENGIAFASSAAGTGLYLSLSCYYSTAPATGVPLPVLDGISSPGAWRVRGQGSGFPDNSHIIWPSHPAMAGLTDGSLSNWTPSTHEAFSSWPTDFQVLVISRDIPSGFVAPDGSTGAPYILARNVDLGFDPGTPGPLAVSRREYDLGDTAYTPPGPPAFPAAVEVRGSVTYPTDLSAGPFPFIVFLHGRHATCFQGTSAFLQWPCVAPRQPIPSFRGYDYVSQVLASNGYIVISISANGINARDNSVFDLGALARAQLIQRHLDLWQQFNTVGAAPFGGMFIGTIDLDNVGTMGHSRGGEGVVRHFQYNQSLGSPYGIRAVFPLAPVDFNRPVINRVPLSVLLPYCDGDVSDLQGVHFYDDARYNVPGDQASKHTILIKGANHNFYNTIWTPGGWPAGTIDDWNFVPGGAGDPHCGSGAGNARLSPAEQRGTAVAYLSAFFRTYLGFEGFDPVLTGDAPPPPSAQTDQVLVSFHPPDHPALRRDVNRLLTSSNLSVNTLGGAASQVGFTPYDLCGGAVPQPQFCLTGQSNARQPHTTPSARAPGVRGLSQLRGGWTMPTALYRNDIPGPSGDVLGYDVLQFRVSVNFADGRNPSGQPRDLSMVLVDGSGRSASALVSDTSDALFFPPGSVGPVPKVLLNTARVPLSSFVGVNLADLRSVQLRFDQVPSGALLISDLAFAGSAVLPPDPQVVSGGSSRVAVTRSGAPTQRGPRPARTRVITPPAPAAVERGGTPPRPNLP